MDDQEKLKVRFWSKVNKTDNCWNWVASVDRVGYGHIFVQGKLKQAHRVSWVLHHGLEPKNNILHKCDNRRCVNPDHLFDGTQKENVRDAMNKGRRFEQSIKHCSKGHLYTEENQRFYTDSRKKSRQRYCLICSTRKDAIRRKSNHYRKALTFGGGNADGFGFCDGTGFG